jgi:hypothetical protein
VNPIYKIIARLPVDRDFAGLLQLQGPGGEAVAGPFDVCAPADDQISRQNHNPDRSPLLPFGDMPLGNYRVAQIKVLGGISDAGYLPAQEATALQTGFDTLKAIAIEGAGEKVTTQIIVQQPLNSLNEAMSGNFNAQRYLQAKLDPINHNISLMQEKIDNYRAVHPQSEW